MNGRKIPIALVLLAFIGACLLTTTAMPGEHPWDSDIIQPEDIDTELWELYLKFLEDQEEKRDGQGGDTKTPDDTAETQGSQSSAPRPEPVLSHDSEMEPEGWFEFIQAYLELLLVH